MKDVNLTGGICKPLVLICAAVFCLSYADLAAGREPFIIGADISWIPEDEAAGAQYFDRGVRKDIFEILKHRRDR